jgi:radical SAM superfamily enzyme YgiQ (UPF0313 family)
MKPVDILRREIELIRRLSRSRYLVVSDDSFGADPERTRKETLPLLQGSGRGWFAEITVERACELLEDMARSGCVALYIGIESIFEQVGNKSRSREQVEEVIERAHKSGMLVVGSFILDVVGNETLSSIDETINWAIEVGLDFAQLSLTSLLPGTRLRREAKECGRLIDDNSEHLDGAWPTKWHHLSAKKRINALNDSYDRFYSLGRVLARLFQGHILQQKGTVLAAYKQIIKSASHWKENYNFEHWKSTRMVPKKTQTA